MKNIFLVATLLFLPAASFAAEVRVGQPLSEVRVGDSFVVEVTLDTAGAALNAIEGGIEVSSNLKIVEVRSARSIVPLWIVSPVIERGGTAVSFAGAIPGGFEGVVGPTWVGFLPGTLFSLVLEARGEGSASITPTPRTITYLHDGEGTEAPTSSFGVRFDILPGTNTTQEVLNTSDSIPPEPFTPELFDGGFFRFQNIALVFATVDKQTAVTKYELAFSDREKSEQELSWREVQSPIELSLFDRLKYIYVRAVDAAGNTRIAVIPPEETLPQRIALDAVFIVAVFGAFLFVLWRVTRKNKL